LGDRTRRSIFEKLADGERAVGQLLEDRSAGPVPQRVQHSCRRFGHIGKLQLTVSRCQPLVRTYRGVCQPRVDAVHGDREQIASEHHVVRGRNLDVAAVAKSSRDPARRFG